MFWKSGLDASMNNEPSEIQRFYEGLSIFITGGSGFLGNLLIQKLIRECPNLSKIYLLMRPKKGKSSEERLDKMFEDPVFDKMKVENPDFKTKIIFVNGDLQNPNLGLGDEDKKFISEDVNVVFHLAATVRFDETLKDAASINLRGSKELLELAKTMNNLKAFVYCSTAYCHCTRSSIDETFYDVPYTPERVLHLIDTLDDEELECLTQKIISPWPNTYTFTKALAENLYKKEGKCLPITIVRPALVTPTAGDPLDGWVNNLNGPIGLSVACIHGVLRIVGLHKDVVCNFVPGDYVINNMIVAGQYIGTTFDNSNKKNTETTDGIISPDDIPIFNCVSHSENPFTWGEFQEYGYKHVHWSPPTVMWYGALMYCTNPYLLKIFRFLLHTLPAYLLDFLLVLKGKRKRVVKLVGKIHYFFDISAFFMSTDWIFFNNNNQMLWKRLNSTDQKLFQFCMKNIHWETYMAEHYLMGLYRYAMKMPLDKYDEACTRFRRLKIIHYIVVYSFCILCAILVLKLFT